MWELGGGGRAGKDMVFKGKNCADKGELIMFVQKIVPFAMPLVPPPPKPSMQKDKWKHASIPSLIFHYSQGCLHLDPPDWHTWGEACVCLLFVFLKFNELLDSTKIQTKILGLLQVKVVIIGQDPYHGPGQAHGTLQGLLVLYLIFKFIQNNVMLSNNWLPSVPFVHTVHRSVFQCSPWRAPTPKVCNQLLYIFDEKNSTHISSAIQLCQLSEKANDNSPTKPATRINNNTQLASMFGIKERFIRWYANEQTTTVGRRDGRESKLGHMKHCSKSMCGLSEWKPGVKHDPGGPVSQLIRPLTTCQPKGLQIILYWSTTWMMKGQWWRCQLLKTHCLIKWFIIVIKAWALISSNFHTYSMHYHCT